MFNDLIDRFGSNLGLSPEEAMKSDLVKKLCSALVHGQLVVIDSNQSKLLTFDLEEIQQNSTELPNEWAG